MRSALVCGTGGFIGGHLVKRLTVEDDCDRKHHEYSFRGLELTYAWIEPRTRSNTARLAA